MYCMRCREVEPTALERSGAPPVTRATSPGAGIFQRCTRCGSPLLGLKTARVVLRKLAQLDRFGLREGSLLEPGQVEAGSRRPDS